ncbi:DoxX family protein [Aureibacter tunicatorum]|uniref:Membrane protein YphA (DoxX/SURF4 family) n=1 Tax=Aureibacter tunicatorum TaxID=866807 RepID=A0AAE3XNB0_9BACT|nr:DoxX family protein [Aureibacter tunicatorum]MDR6238876.1 putative membrane protein YphA (DoxX/SURF4 family) [Aureibacter tunicatorum]BDD05197.1 hypothetical protein AUTU_26800 [Aureibacter tunicatorum]
MKTLFIIIQLLVAFGIFNVWLIRFNHSSEWRGSNARNMKEEFEAYGLPVWFLGFIGFLKLLCASLLVLGLWFPEFVRPAAYGLVLLMMGAISMHFRVKDPMRKSYPAIAMLGMSLFLAVA